MQVKGIISVNPSQNEHVSNSDLFCKVMRGSTHKPPTHLTVVIKLEALVLNRLATAKAKRAKRHLNEEILNT